MKWTATEGGNYTKKCGKLEVDVFFTDRDPRGPWEWVVRYDGHLIGLGSESTPVTTKRVCSEFVRRVRAAATSMLSRN